MKKEQKRNLPAYIKINAIMDYIEGRIAKRAIAEKYGVSHVSISNWVKEKDNLLRECGESARLLEGWGLPLDSQPVEPLQEAPMQTEKDRATLLAENRKLCKENEYLVHRRAYRESLAKLMGFNLGSTRKKRFEAIDLVIESRGKGNVMLLCASADVSRKCYYEHRLRRAVVDPI